MMKSASLLTPCAVALKEWATVLEAMSRGEQLVLIRKGGLIEPGSGFELLAPTFLFYPTFEHQAVAYLRSPHQRYFNEALQRRAPEGQIALELVGLAVSSLATRDPAVVERLSPFHVYHETFLTQRLKWQPEQPLVIVVVRVFRLTSPRRIPVISRYAGCKSWVELETPLPVERARPVLDDASFQRSSQAIAGLLASA